MCASAMTHLAGLLAGYSPHIYSYIYTTRQQHPENAKVCGKSADYGPSTGRTIAYGFWLLKCSVWDERRLAKSANALEKFCVVVVNNYIQQEAMCETESGLIYGQRCGFKLIRAYLKVNRCDVFNIWWNAWLM